MELQLLQACYVPNDERRGRPVQVISNPLTVKIDMSPKKSPKYKKVGKVSKGKLLELVDEGCSIISVSL